jgi:4-hydroxybutyrate dehydrogenase/sulfolactaldehyde 3-reductase
MATIGFIGLGRMGRPMATNLVRKGFELVVLDINPQGVAALVEAGAKAGASVAGIARASDIIVTMLPSSVEVEAVAGGADGIFANARKGALFMDMSTIDPLATDRLAAAAAAHGLTMVDAPVGRLAEHADRAESLFMVGASEADFARVKPLFEAMGNAIYHCGPVGSGGRTKLVNNYVAITLTQVNAEALALSQRFGLDLDKTMQVLLGTSASNGQLRMNFPSKVLAGDTTPGFTIDLAHKDLSLIQAAAHAAKVPMPVAGAVHESFSLARAAGQGAIDFSGIADVLCGVANIDKPRLPKGWKPG